jgi:carotenoid cleavage dioxygenase-like enzyme
MSSNFDPAGSPFLNGIFAPTQSELDETPVAVISGAVPADLDGTYYRNGPNSRFAPLGSYTYPLDGDGMLHAVHPPTSVASRPPCCDFPSASPRGGTAAGCRGDDADIFPALAG